MYVAEQATTKKMGRKLFLLKKQTMEALTHMEVAGAHTIGTARERTQHTALNKSKQ
jgi:hypothetical protein